ncbi:hypothetical protein SPRG_07614 [Saprolegnia parasitica CBS 223.65]|uniref:TPX2 C-terminal domain-containing protein n=1 Tax=Saprolegnia parasitica (strain CBS 223.65) TaxID=695850 RepID=A0A067C8R1_SAPPC|nr:hypothetical protein SPRG_07614 [Saprolegnia parasitica CBS 223.65]KDO26898.1 hypothetical protein SPRG_07614 [Saprolegnia parasitica CBS 223.65]|eukprot:XP_012202285.1 hypothetical protein SPRG_07614 [Saprolegnia parasitica CBS 223.65]
MADVIEFDAPSYYDLNDTDFEKAYINNADGYFGDCADDAEFDFGGSNQARSEPADDDMVLYARSHATSDDDGDDGADVASNNHSSSHGGSQRNAKTLVPHSRKPLTKPASPRLQTSRRAQTSSSHRKVYTPPDTDAIEMAKQFHALPLPSTHAAPTIAPRLVERAATKKPTTPRIHVPMTTDRFGARVPLVSPVKPQAKPRRPHGLSEDATPRVARAVSQSSPRPQEVAGPRPKLEKSKSVGNVMLEPDLTVQRSEERARKRQELELRRRQLLAEREALKQAEEARRAEEALARERDLRLQQSFKAKPVRRPKEPFRIAPSSRELTMPKSPKCLRPKGGLY